MRNSLSALKQKLHVGAVERVERYRVTLTDGTSHLIDFIPVAGVPGFTHRIAWNNTLTKKYLHETYGSGKWAALYMLDMLLEEDAK